MKKVVVYGMAAALLMSSCGTYEGAGAYSGAQFGSILGSAIGGITDGGRGHDVGTIVGMVGGAAIGGAIGAAKDKKNRQEVHDRYQQVQQRKAQKKMSQRSQDDYSGFDATNSGDDRLYDFNGPEYNNDFMGQQPVAELSDKTEKPVGRIVSFFRKSQIVDLERYVKFSRPYAQARLPWKSAMLVSSTTTTTVSSAGVRWEKSSSKSTTVASRYFTMCSPW